MEKIQTLVAASQFAMCIFGNSRTGEFALADLGPAAMDLQTALIVGGMCLVGAVGVVNGTAHIALAEPLGDEVLSQISTAFIAHFERIVERVERDGAGVMWLEELLRLPDTRD